VIRRELVLARSLRQSKPKTLQAPHPRFVKHPRGDWERIGYLVEDLLPPVSAMSGSAVHPLSGNGIIGDSVLEQGKQSFPEAKGCGLLCLFLLLHF
jgi:hypothetical protein